MVTERIHRRKKGGIAKPRQTGRGSSSWLLSPLGTVIAFGWLSRCCELATSPRRRAQAELLKSTQSLAGQDCYNLGCLLSLCADSVQKDASVSAAERSRLVDSYIRDALHWLRSARNAGFFDNGGAHAIAGQDSDLAILAGRAEFRQLLEEPPGTR